MGIKTNQLAVVTSAAGDPLALNEQGTSPAAAANKIKLYSKDILGVSEFFVRDDAGNEVRVTSGGRLVGGPLPFTTLFSTAGTFPAVLGAINLIGYTGITLTLPATPNNLDRLAFLAGISFDLDGGTVNIIDPVSGSPSATITLSSGPAYYIEFQYSALLTAWIPLSRGG